MKYATLLMLIFVSSICYTQDYGDFPTIEKELLLRDLEILHQALDQYHSGMYWYTSRDSVEVAFQKVRKALTKDLNVLEYHKLIAPLIGLSREDHTDISLPEDLKNRLIEQAKFFPALVTFLGRECYLIRNGSNKNGLKAGVEIKKINGEPIEDIVAKIGNLFPSDGYIEAVKYSDLRGFEFSKFYYYYYGKVNRFTLELEDEIITIDALSVESINQNIKERYKDEVSDTPEKEPLEFRVISDSIAYMGLHTFINDQIKQGKVHNKLSAFLEESFALIADKNIKHLIIDLSENGGGNEGNENLVYAYVGENYQKYKRVRAKAQKLIIDNGVDKPIKLKTFGFFERIFANKKMEDGSYERKENIGHGLMAYKKDPQHKFKGELYVLISPVTYSGGSELSNMIYTSDLGTFVGLETGGGYYGNTSGYSEELTLPHSKIMVDIPSLQFEMNVKETIPFGRGVIPHYQVIPTFEQYVNNENAALNFTLNLIMKQ